MTGRLFLCRAMWPLALMITIIWSSGTSGPDVPDALAFPHLDKVVHFFAFGLMATLIYRTIPPWVKRRKAMILVILLTSGFGFSDELRQSFNPDRYTTITDWLADTLGAIVAVTAYRFWPFYRNLLETSVNPFRRNRHGGRYHSQAYSGIASRRRSSR